jgi:hypothetical protein
LKDLGLLFQINLNSLNDFSDKTIIEKKNNEYGE